jgi:hypothetical protein
MFSQPHDDAVKPKRNEPDNNKPHDCPANHERDEQNYNRVVLHGFFLNGQYQMLAISPRSSR